MRTIENQSHLRIDIDSHSLYLCAQLLPANPPKLQAYSHIGPYASSTTGTSRPQRFSFMSPFEVENAQPRARILSEWGFEPRKYCAFFANMTSGIPPAHRARHRRTLSRSVPGEHIRESLVESVLIMLDREELQQGVTMATDFFRSKKAASLAAQDC